MATLKVKNRYEIAFIKMIKDSNELGGIPDFIEINGREAWELLNEIRAVKSDKIVVNAGTEYDPQFILKGSTDKIEHKVAEDLVTRWFKDEFGVSFIHEDEEIPIIVKAELKRREKPVDEQE